MAGISVTGQVPSAAPSGQWTTGLFDCFDDFSNCCITLWCPCITFGRIAEIVDKGSTTCGVSGSLYCLIACITGCQFIYTCFYRTKLRAQYSLPEDPCHDCLVHCCCHECALCQEYRELRNRGFHMSVGWDDNMERMAVQRQGTNVPPHVHGGMTR